MDRESIKELLTGVSNGTTDVEDALEKLARMPVEDLGFARIDHHRALRHGFSEVVFGEGKQPEHFAAIFGSLAARGPRVIGTRVPRASADAALLEVPRARYHDLPRMLVLDESPLERLPGVGVLCAGTSDLPVAEEAALTLETMGNQVERFFDVGVAGLHRLLAVLERVRRCRVLVVVAGMEGALPSVVAGLVSVPVIAVPTSVGYGASFGGLAALLAMLNGCSSGVAVVNIDNGFGAGTLASMINRNGEDR